MVAIRGFVFKYGIFIEDSCLCFRGDNFKCLLSVRGVRGVSAVHVNFTVARQAPRLVVSQIVFPVWCFKLEVYLWGGIPGVCLARIFYWASVRWRWKVKCIVESAASRIVLVLSVII